MPSNHFSSYLPLITITRHLLAERHRQSSNFLIEEILSLSPNTGSAAVLQLKKTGQESLAELLGALTGEQGGQVVNADDAQRRALSVGGQLDGHGRLVEGGGDVVDGDRVVRVGAVKISSLGASVNFTFEYGVTYVSALTSQTTDRARLGEDRVSTFTKGAIGELR